MRILIWLVRATLFFTLFAFALNNQHDASVKWFFNQEWRAPMVFIVLAAFAVGCAFGVLAMVPSWWQHRRAARLRQGAPATGDPLDTRADVPPVLDSRPSRDEL